MGSSVRVQARWALERAGVSYTETKHVVLLHMLFTRLEVPNPCGNTDFLLINGSKILGFRTCGCDSMAFNMLDTLQCLEIGFLMNGLNRQFRFVVTEIGFHEHELMEQAFRV